MTPSPPSPWQPWLKVTFVAWLVCLTASLGGLWAYSARPGDSGHPPATWPEEVPRAQAGFTLVLFCHPHCPCTRATVHELERLVVDCGGDLEVVAYLVLAEGVPEGWERGPILKLLSGLEEADVRLDHGGRLARRFHASTSGTVALYDPRGELVFSGGITPSRGHEGTNRGRSAVAELVRGERPSFTEVPVYGCPLRQTSDPAHVASGACCGR